MTSYASSAALAFALTKLAYMASTSAPKAQPSSLLLPKNMFAKSLNLSHYVHVNGLLMVCYALGLFSKTAQAQALTRCVNSHVKWQ